MNIILNGEKITVRGSASVTDILEERNIDPKTVIVELDGIILKQEEFKDSVLCEDSTVEVLRFVGGG